ncbi:hypothetical protein LTR12_017881 [Friedmanniomyces endolithicus]|nr:hypothetical protein LTR12_017881 [Friedmanniomyces endolithicus]
MSKHVSHLSPDLSILGDSLQVHPPSIAADQTSQEQSLLEPYARFRSDPINALQEFGLHLTGTGWRSYDKVVGTDIFYPGFSENMRAMVMRQGKLQNRISELAQKRVEVEIHEGLLGPKGLDGEVEEHITRRLARRRQLEEELRRVADEWTDKMICKMDSKLFIRGAYYLCTQLLTRAYHQGIHVSSHEVMQLRAVAEKAAAKKQSIIFLPCHRSHVDYVSLQLVCYRLGLALPTVVAGDNLNFPVIGPFLQHAGAMWIRRSFGDDQLYATLVQSYMDTLLQNGYNIECFVEGGRSRTGKLLQPKFGILSFLLDSVLSGRVEDAIVELLGQPKPKEDLFQFLSASNVLSLKLGRVDVRFHEPWSLRGFIDQQRSRLVKSPSIETMYDAALKRKLLTTLGYKVLKEINDVSVVMPTALVGTVLLTLRGRGVAQGGRVAHFAESTTDVVVDKALAVLGPKLVGRVDDLPEETFYAEDRFQLSFYRNMTIHLFVSQALVCAAVYTKVKLGGGPEGQRISYTELMDYVLFLSQLFRAEFIYPTEGLRETLDITLQGLERDGVLTTSRNNVVSNEIEYIELHPQERASGRENFDFYCFLIWPFIEASWLGAISLFMLTPPPHHSDTDTETWADYNTVQDRAQLLGKTLYHQGDLSYFEAVNKEALKNAFSRSEEEGIIAVQRPRGDGKVSPKVRLEMEWTPARDEGGGLMAEGRLWEMCERISQSRREGKNRRDGTTVRTRVLGLAELVGRDLFGDVVVGDEGPASSARRRRSVQMRAQL